MKIAEKTGFAHFFEHLMFSETENIPAGKIEEYIQSAGGNFNAHTSFEETVYKITLPSHQLPLALWIESERMQNLKINKEKCRKRKKSCN
jgi:zinc protease